MLVLVSVVGAEWLTAIVEVLISETAATGGNAGRLRNPWAGMYIPSRGSPSRLKSTISTSTTFCS